MRTRTESGSNFNVTQRNAPVWKFFKIDGDIKSCLQVGCKFMSTEKQASNMERHLKCVHKDVYATVERLKAEKKMLLAERQHQQQQQLTARSLHKSAKRAFGTRQQFFPPLDLN
jgi:hypothetical protein